MCGIVGLFTKDDRLVPELGAHLSAMLGVMCDRGPDSAGFAVYGAAQAGRAKITVRGTEDQDFGPLVAMMEAAGAGPVTLHRRGTHAVIGLASTRMDAARHLVATVPDITLVGAGEAMELYKEVGLPSDVAMRFELATMVGTHGIGHTRMATESAVTTDGAHPFSTGPDQCLVHNGSLSNHNGVRRDLLRKGMRFSSDNDSEVAAAYLSQRMGGGDTLGEALEHALDDLDGFYTFVVGTRTGFGVLRDPIACKPAVMAETGSYVAFGSEYRALVDLPGIAQARIWEPEPGRVYFWERAA